MLKKIEYILDKYHCAIVSKPFYGITLIGEEKQIRKLIQSIYAFYQMKIQEAFPMYSANEQEIGGLLNSYKVATTSTSLQSICEYWTIALNRMRIGKYEKMDIQELSYCYEMKEFHVAEAIVEIYEKRLAMTIPVEETAILSQYLNGNRKYDQECLEKFEASIHHDLDRLLHKIFSHIQYHFHHDFSHDFELYVSLGLHMIPLISRIRFDFGVNNPLLDDIKKLYPLAYEIAVETSIVIQEEFDIKLNEDEIGYFALHFNLALERKKQASISLKNVLIVCSSGGGLAKLLAFKVKMNFSQYISQVDTVDFHELAVLDLKEYDYILTTVPLQTEVSKPVLQISHMLSRHDIGEISHLLMGRKEELGLLDILRAEDFFVNVEKERKEDVIYEIYQRLKQHHQLQEDFYEQILKREELFSTEIDNRIAFPHPLIQKTEETFMSITVLNKPIYWNHKLVQIVMIGNVKQGDSIKAQRMYEEFSLFVSNWDSILELLRTPTFATVIKIIKEIRRNENE